MTYLMTIAVPKTMRTAEMPKPTFSVSKNAQIVYDDDDDFKFNLNIKKGKINSYDGNQLPPVVIKKISLVESDNEIRGNENDKYQWDKHSILYSAKNVDCKNTIIRVPNGPQFKICLRSNKDAYTEYVQSTGKAYCRRKILKLWNKISIQNPKGYFMEVGGGYGACAMHMSSFNIRSYIIEPSPENLNTITKSLLENKEILNHIVLYPFAVGEKNGRITLYSNKFDWTSSSIAIPPDVPETQIVNNIVEIKELDDIISSQRLDINILYLDASGYEYKILKGAERTLNNRFVKAFYIHVDCNKLSLFGNTPDDIFRLLESYGYIIRKRYKKSCDILADHYVVATL